MRRNVYLPPDIDAWLVSQPGGRSAAIRELVRREIAAAGQAATPGGGLSATDLAALEERIRARVLAEVRQEIQAAGPRPPAGEGRPPTPPAALDEDEQEAMRGKAAQTVARWL